MHYDFRSTGARFRTNEPASCLPGEPRRGKESRDGLITRILSVSHLVEDHVALRRLFEGTGWATSEAYCCREALAAIAELDLDVVFCEASLPDGNWKDILEDFSRRENPPYLIVTSRLADERLWAEVLNLGGYDVLAKPFDAEEVCHIVGLACGHLREQRIRRAAEGNVTTTR